MDIHSQIIKIIATGYSKETDIFGFPKYTPILYHSLDGKFLFEHKANKFTLENGLKIYSKEIDVIITTFIKGNGTANDLYRESDLYFDLNGTFLFEVDQRDVAIEKDKMLRNHISDND